MNPLGIKPERFTVVEDTNGAGIVGFAQLAPLPGQNNLEFRSLIVLPEHRCVACGAVGSTHCVCVRTQREQLGLQPSLPHPTSHCQR